VGDDTHGHVDDVTRFVSPDTVVTCVDADPRSKNYEALRENIRRLAGCHDGRWQAAGNDRSADASSGLFRRPAASRQLCELLHRDGVVLVPVFNDPNDRVALDIFADIFPDREIVGIYCGDLIWGFGANPIA